MEGKLTKIIYESITTNTSEAINDESTPLSAKDQVLGLPELLENILAQLRPKDWDEPALQIYQLQRICRTWRSIINGSQRLQELMGLIPPESTPDRYKAASWLLHRIHNHTSHFSPDTGMLETSELNTANRFAIDFLQESRASSRTEASWRRMKIPNMEIRVPVRYGIQISDYLLGPVGARQYYRVYFDVWRFAEGQFVGDVLEKYVEVMERTAEEHQLLKAARRRELLR